MGDDSYALRRDNSRRLWSGLNVIFFCDFWQIPPVCATSMTANPFDKHTARGSRILDMFWTRGRPDSLTHAFFLEGTHRCPDVLLNACLREARDGCLSWTMYNFIHGYHTLVPGSWLPDVCGDSGSLSCGSDLCEMLWKTEWSRLFADGVQSNALLAMECRICQAERVRRDRLLKPGSTSWCQRPFCDAPYIHPFNEPKSHVHKLCAVQFARSHQEVLLWSLAEDRPLSIDDSLRSPESQAASNKKWLTYTESKTAGVPGMLPLIKSMPIRFSDNIDVQRGACKHATGTLRGWTLADADVAALCQSTAGQSAAWDPAANLLKAGAWRCCRACHLKLHKPTTSSAATCFVPAIVPSLIKCYVCVQCLSKYLFPASTLGTLLQDGLLWRAICLRCDPSGLKTSIRDANQLHTCMDCGMKKESSAFPISVFQRSACQLKCAQCSEKKLRPFCFNCGEQPDRPIQHPVEIYMCPECRYPNCDKCHQTPRPRNGKYSVLKRSWWTCADCRCLSDDEA